MHILELKIKLDGWKVHAGERCTGRIESIYWRKIKLDCWRKKY